FNVPAPPYIYPLSLHDALPDLPATMTVARMEIVPNIPNVVPGEVRFSIDARNPDHRVERQLMAAASQRAHDTARARGLECTVERSEEHTSELQSQSNLVCRLLL